METVTQKIDTFVLSMDPLMNKTSDYASQTRAFTCTERHLRTNCKGNVLSTKNAPALKESTEEGKHMLCSTVSYTQLQKARQWSSSCVNSKENNTRCDYVIV